MNTKFENFVNENINAEDWAIFILSYGKISFVTSLNNTDDGVIRDSISTSEYNLKYSDEKVLKFTLDRAKEIIRKNISVSQKIGVVNSKGIQKLFDWRVKFPNKYDDNGKEIN